MSRAVLRLCACVHLVLAAATWAADAPARGEASASTTAPGARAAGAIDGEKFACTAGAFWQGAAGEKSWWWQVRFTEARPIGAILQINGDAPCILQNAPKKYRGQTSADGAHWEDVA